MHALFSPSRLAVAVACVAFLFGRSALADDEAPSSSAPVEAGGKAGGATLSSLDSKTLQSMVIVEGERGRGSAFVVKMDGKVYVVTNSHVVRGNPKVKFKKLNNEDLEFGPLEIADHADLVRAELRQPGPALELLPHADEKLVIGDEVVVAGNAEGAGVVREIPGKIVGLGPDRLEVDATFVPGNSGSPILLKSTRQVVGVATYVHIPYFFRRSASKNAANQPITSLNEVRRFGYRLDTVGKWIKPEAADGLVQEGMKLKAIEELGETISTIVNVGATTVAGIGSSAFIRDERKSEPHFRELAAAIDEFATQYRAAKEPEEKNAAFLKFFGQLDAATQEDIKGESPEKFSGFYAEQFKEFAKWRKGMREWLDFIVHQPDNNSWINGVPWMRWTAPSVDLAKLHLMLTDSFEPTGTPDRHHRVGYPEGSRPASLENIYWIVQAPAKEPVLVAMHGASIRFNTPANGIYHISAEYRAGKITQKISNVVEINITDLPQPNVEIDFSKEVAPAMAAEDHPALPDWEGLDRLIAAEAYAKTPFIGHEATAQMIKDIPAAGGVLVGFDMLIGPFHNSTECVRGAYPIFLTKTETKDGQLWGGKRGADASHFRILARPGYAVGKVWCVTDGVAIKRIKVRFDRIYGLKLNPKENYETEWIGQWENGQESSVDTNGHLPVGLAGKAGAGLDAIRLVCLTSFDPNALPAPPVAAPAPETFDSIDAILKAAPPPLMARLGGKDTRDDAIQQLNQFFATHIKSKPLAMRVTVESADPVEGGNGRYAIKLPEGRSIVNPALGSRVWIYFQPENAPTDPIAIGAKVRVSGVISRCDITPGDRPLLNVDVGRAKLEK